MSKTSRGFLLLAVLSVAILSPHGKADAQDMQAVVTIDSKVRNRVHVKGKQLRQVPLSIFCNLCFSADYMRIVKGFAGRFSNVQAQDDAGKSLAVRKLESGTFDAETHPVSWSYDIDLAALNDVTSATLISWLNENHGVLMIDDLLPQDKGLSARVKIEVPDGWRIFSAEPEIGPGEFDLADIQKVVVFIGQGWRVTNLSRNGASVRVLVRDEWHFSDKEVANLADEVWSQYLEVLGSLRNSQYQIGLSKLPSTVASGTWTANTQGPNITIASSDMPFKTQSLQRLHEQLRHEVFHLWIPNGVNLTGNYDWFYEGFALYQSLKMGVAVNRIRFDDYLDTLSRAYDIDRRSRPRLSLIDASKNRWSGENNTTVYARGMLVAFLCDVALLDASKGRRSADDLVREVYTRHRPPAVPQDANQSILSILLSHKELGPIVDRYITGADLLDWNVYLRAAGLESAPSSSTTRLAVAAKPSGRQKNLLDKLGYNSWRKLSIGVR